ncbi:MAG: CHAT domain-containing protein [Phycisphaerales bacterium]
MPERPANGTPRKVFVSYVWADQAAVLALVEALRASGIDAWFDLFEVKPGDDIVARMNEGLERCDVAIAVFSKHSRETGWASAGVSYLTYARVAEGKPLIPVAADDTPYIPPLLRPLARRGIDQVDAIIEAIEHRGAPPPLGSRPTSRVHRVRFVLERAQGDGFTVAVELDGRSCGAPTPARLTSALIAARGAFLAGFHHGVRRSPQQAEHAAQERSLVQLGTALCDACLSRDATEQLVELLDGAGKQVGTTIEVVFDASDPELLGLPFEALRLPVDGLPAGRLLATEPAVVIFRRPLGTKPPPHVALAGPLKILVAVGAPDEGNTTSVVLDHERELNNILDAVEGERGHENVDVRFLEVGSPDEIGAALAHDAYHVLHLSCHGMPGKLELENEDGEAVLTTSTDLMRPVRESHRPLPLVLLNACHTGVAAGQTASFAEELLRAGVPAVLAMQAAVSDGYATAIAREFFAQLVVVATERPMASRALATARKVLERQRAEAIRRGAPTHETQPEYATATLFIAGEEKPLADFGLDKAPLRARTVHHFGGPVPQLDMDDLIGRRKELRGTLRTLRGTNVADGIPDPSVGVVLTGIGGVGKSAVAGRAMRRLVESGFLVPAHVGRWDLGRIAGAVGTAMERSGVPAMQRDGALLADPQLRDEVRTRLLIDVLAEHPIALVLDDFEQNLALGGGTFLDPSLPAYLERLVQSLRRGRLLVTCRHPVPGFDAHLRHIPIPPLSPAETRKLFRRLPALKDRPFSELAEVLRAIGGHPRMLEFVDALLRGGKGRLPHVTTKLKATLEKAGANTSGSAATLDEGVQKAVLLGARDVFLDELLAIARAEGIDELLLQASVSNLPVTASGLARMLAGGSGTPTPSQIGHIVSALARLDELSLLFRFGEEIGWVHRWTAEGLARLTDAAGHLERHNRAGRYRRWRIENETHALDDGIEAIRNHLTGRDFDSAADIAEATCEALTRLRQTAAAAALASEVLETLPTDHPSFGVLADAEGRAHLALGEIDRAKKRYEQLHHVWTARAAAHPARADYQRDLAVSHERMGDLYSALGLGEQARAHYQRDLDIAERLAAAEPGRADYQRDLSVSHNKMGHLYRALGLGEQAALLPASTRHQRTPRRSRARTRRLPEGPLRLTQQDGRPVQRPRTWRAGSRPLPTRS